MKEMFPSLPENASLGDVFKAFPATIRPLLEYHDLLLRGESDLTVGERELIAAYVSGVNACSFCHNAHVLYARAFGIADGMIDAMMTDLESAPIEAKLKPLLAYVAKLTKSPSLMTETDARAVYAAGWSEGALFDAIQTCGLFNLMNRIIEGTGIAAYPLDPDKATEADLAARRARSYADFGREIGVMD